MSTYAAADAETSCSGWLIKRGSVRKNWLRRFFILSNGRLEYYESPNSTQPLGVMSLFGASVRFMSEAIRKNCMEVATNHRRLYISSDEAQEIQDWSVAISKEIDSLKQAKIPPIWRDANECEICNRNFTFTRRKHHCRACGGIFCQMDSSYKVPLPQYGINKAVRVCIPCYTERFKDKDVNVEAADDIDDDIDDQMIEHAKSRRVLREYSEIDLNLPSNTSLSSSSSSSNTKYVSVFNNNAKNEEDTSTNDKNGEITRNTSERNHEEEKVVERVQEGIASMIVKAPRKRTASGDLQKILQIIAGNAAKPDEDEPINKEPELMSMDEFKVLIAKRENRKVNKPNCEKCGQRPKSVYCFVCNSQFCLACSQQEHSETYAKRQHKRVPISRRDSYIKSTMTENTPENLLARKCFTHNPNAELEEKLHALQQGSEIWKLPSGNFTVPKLTLCYLKPNINGVDWNLYWSSKKVGDDSFIVLKNCKIVKGQNGDEVWKRHKFKKRFGNMENLSFSIISPKRSLNLCCCDEVDFDLWMDVLEYICK